MYRYTISCEVSWFNLLWFCVCLTEGWTSKAGVQCRGHSGFPPCKHGWWVAPPKNTFNIEVVNDYIPDIKLIRTDTTLDLSQKAEKGMKICATSRGIYCFSSQSAEILAYGSEVSHLAQIWRRKKNNQARRSGEDKKITERVLLRTQPTAPTRSRRRAFWGFFSGTTPPSLKSLRCILRILLPVCRYQYYWYQ